MPRYSLDNVTINWVPWAEGPPPRGPGTHQRTRRSKQLWKDQRFGSIIHSLQRLRAIRMGLDGPPSGLWSTGRDTHSSRFGGASLRDEIRPDPELTFEGECGMTCDGRLPLRTLRVTYREIVGDPDPQQTQRRGRGLVTEGREAEARRRRSVTSSYVMHRDHALPRRSDTQGGPSVGGPASPRALPLIYSIFSSPQRRDSDLRTTLR